MTYYPFTENFILVDENGDIIVDENGDVVLK